MDKGGVGVSCFRQRRQAATVHRWVDLHTGEAVTVIPASGDESDRVLDGGGTWG